MVCCQGEPGPSNPTHIIFCVWSNVTFAEVKVHLLLSSWFQRKRSGIVLFENAFQVFRRIHVRINAEPLGLTRGQ
jgi:hypothetical protein